jgi:hypothetical protein
MSNKRDDMINNRLDEISGFIKHSETDKKKAAELEAQKQDILKELPEDIYIEALRNGMPLEDLRKLYAETKSEYYAHKLELQGQKFGNNERRQDNVRERILEKEKERQNEQTHTRSRRREYQRERYHS